MFINVVRGARGGAGQASQKMWVFSQPWKNRVKLSEDERVGKTAVLGKVGGRDLRGPGISC